MNPLDGCQQSDQRNDTGKRYNIKRKVKWAQVVCSPKLVLEQAVCAATCSISRCVCIGLGNTIKHIFLIVRVLGGILLPLVSYKHLI